MRAARIKETYMHQQVQQHRDVLDALRSRSAMTTADATGAPMTMAFSNKSWLGALSMAYDAGIENVHAWTSRFWVGGQWQVQYEVKA